ncbi:hypothetical protein B9Z55_001024 [Caenorhabditis nigoni]|uniref:Uncharacterized protein n=1 Tax=Caenorhabditis nigoni TaxID=1611254 RepID=A0A2G5VDV7_9PELO|nr:hypothetical protein B9Z55_001024 [Caenorhabditis nigoni]
MGLGKTNLSHILDHIFMHILVIYYEEGNSKRSEAIRGFDSIGTDFLVLARFSGITFRLRLQHSSKRFCQRNVILSNKKEDL